MWLTCDDQPPSPLPSPDTAMSMRSSHRSNCLCLGTPQPHTLSCSPRECTLLGVRMPNEVVALRYPCLPPIPQVWGAL